MVFPFYLQLARVDVQARIPSLTPHPLSSNGASQIARIKCDASLQASLVQSTKSARGSRRGDQIKTGTILHLIEH